LKQQREYRARKRDKERGFSV